MDQDENLVGICEGFGKTLVTITVAICEGYFTLS